MSKFGLEQSSVNKLFGKVLDLTGQRFGRLTAQEYVGNGNWNCLCTCGNHKIYSTSQLRAGNAKTCQECLKNEAKIKIGTRFGRLVVIKQLQEQKRGRAQVRCKCDCGNVLDVLSNSLKMGNTRFCKCWQKEVHINHGKERLENLFGQRFGRLQPKKYLELGKWKCKCNCGNWTNVLSGDLKLGKSKSCGCIQKEKNELSKLKFLQLVQDSPNFSLRGEYFYSVSCVKMFCHEHNREFTCYPCVCLSHKGIYGCPQCKQRSIPERQLVEYVAELVGEKEIILPTRKKEINGSWYTPDLVIPSLKLIIEMNGLYWHSAITNSEKDNSRRHLQRRLDFSSFGYRAISIWEDDWNFRRKAIKNYLRAILQPESLPIYDARKLQVISITQKQANIGLEKYHPQGLAYSKNEWLALILEGKIVACMGFSTTSRPVLLQKNTAELTRYCSKGRVRGGASRLLAHYCQAHPEISRVISFSDNDYFDGGMYLAIGFKLSGEVSSDYTTIWEDRRRHKSFTKRNNLVRLADQGKIIFHPKTMTEKSCLEYNRIRQSWNSGKKRWIYYNPFWKA